MQPTIRKVLYATDFSEDTNQALEMATSLARDNNAELLIVHVFDPPDPIASMPAHSAVPDVSRAEEEHALQRIEPPDPQVKFRHHLLDGAPADAIVQFAEAEEADMIVMSTHGRSGLSRLVMGSVAESVLRHAPCPVITVKAPKNEPAKT
mgnify:CR=1 FL=1